jgi:hypothetical protein
MNKNLRIIIATESISDMSPKFRNDFLTMRFQAPSEPDINDMLHQIGYAERYRGNENDIEAIAKGITYTV